MKPVNYLRSKTTWRWTLIGALVGFFVLHPWVMFTAKWMFQSKDHSENSLTVAILLESQRAFSVQMLPWSLSYALISALSGAFLGRSRHMAAELRKSEQRFRELSITDDLTGLYNTRYFFSRLEAEIDRTNRYEHPLTLLILDLDNFKQYNDAFGHLAGDSVLAETGNIVRTSIRSTDSAYRYGGEEFAVILPESGGQESIYIAERIRKSFENEASFVHKEGGLRVTVSIGVAQYIQGEEILSFIRRADENMYAAKNAGKNRICCAQ